MKLSKRMLSLPPYLSTSWKNVSAMHVKLEPGTTVPILVVHLTDSTSVEIPGLSRQEIDQIYAAHADSIEADEPPEAPGPLAGMPFRIGAMGPEHVGGMLQHDQSQGDAPDLPPEILSKIAGIAQVLGAENADMLPQAEPGCNCFHCQIARAIGGETQEETAQEPEDEVTAEDLRFRTWDIEESDQGANFYTVTNPLDRSEQYQVHLGDPIGCTCGQQSCEHIQAVLRS